MSWKNVLPFSDSSRMQLLVFVLSLILQRWTGHYIVDFCFPLFFISNPTFLRKWGWKMLAALASLAFLNDALAFPQMKLFWKEYFSDRLQALGFGQQHLLENQPRSFFSLLMKYQFGKEYRLVKIFKWAF